MLEVVRSELLKMRHTFSIKLILIAPLTTLLLGYILSGNYAQLSTYNWWYTIILPVLVSVLAAGIIVREKDTGMQNILCLPIPFAKIWFGKVLALTLLLFAAHLFLWLITTTIGYVTSMEVSPLNGLIGCMLLFLSYLWQIPFVMLLANFMTYIPVIILSVSANIVLSAAGVEKNWFFLNPFSIPARVVCPFFGMHPNGLPLEPGSFLLDDGAVLPGLLTSFVSALLIGFLGFLSFLKGHTET